MAGTTILSGTFKKLFLITVGLAAGIAGYFIVPAVKAQSGPPRVAVDTISYGVITPAERHSGYDTCLIVKVHCEGHISEQHNRVYVGGCCNIVNMQLSYFQGGKERVITMPSGKTISGAFTSGGPSRSYFTVWLDLHSLPATSEPIAFKADVNELEVFNLYKNGKAVSSQFDTSASTSLSYTLHHGVS